MNVDSKIWFDQKRYQRSKDSHSLKFVECMASSHSIALYKDAPIGDMLEIEMFKTSEWIMTENENPKYNGNDRWGNLLIPKEARSKKLDEMSEDGEHFQMLQVHKFDFSSDVQRMSVIAKPNFDSDHVCFTKGAPEQILRLCTQESIPADFDEILKSNTSKGKRVIALAYKYLPNFEDVRVEYLKREEIEHSLIFLGFLVMSNNIKPKTKQSIDELREGKYY